MHVPDGFLDAPTSIATGLVAVGAVGLSLRQAEAEIRRTGPALPGLTAAFVFAVQMVNFPVGAGTSGHLLGGALAAALVGPWTAVIVMTVVLAVQALIFADGGLTALGTNVTLLGVVAVAVAYLVVKGLLRVLPQRPASVVPAAAAGAFVSVPAAAVVFTGLYAIGGTVPIPLGSLAAAMIGWHVVIGIGEALITAAVLGAVVATRPDLVHAVRHLRPDLVLVDADGSRRTIPAADSAPVPADRRPLVAGLLGALVVAGCVSLAASAHPDGLEHVAESLGFADAAADSAVAGSPLADYAVAGVGNETLASALAGVAGVGLTVVVGVGAVRLVRRRDTPTASTTHTSG